MMTERWPGTYHGFSGTGAPRRPDDGLRIERPEPRRFEPHEYKLPPKPRRGPSRGLLLGGVAGAVALGLLFGVVARPDFGGGGDDAPRAPMQPVTRTAEDAVATPVPVEVAEAAPTRAPTPPPGAAGKLDVLPPGTSRAATAPAIPQIAPEPRPAPVIETPAPEPREISPAPPRVAEAPPAAQPSFSCRYASTRSERMICEDPELARLDRRLDSAFQRAVASGVPYRELRAEQDDWLAIREDAARRSPEAVESIYRQRIAELEDLAG